MNQKEALENGISPKTLEDFDLPISHLVVREEFSRRGQRIDFHARAVDRLIEMKVPFGTEWNTGSILAKRLFDKVACLYCGAVMKYQTSGGGGNITTIKLICPGCSSSIKLTMPACDGLEVEPPKSRD